MKAIFPLGDSGENSSTRICEMRGCIKTTRDLKPFCPDHVDEHSYVQEILAALNEDKADKEKVRKKGQAAVDLHGMTAKEIRRTLTLNRAKTVERLARDLKLNVVIVRSYIKSMQKKGQVILGRTTRGSTTVRIQEGAA